MYAYFLGFLIGMISAVALKAFFVSVQSSWPTSYSDITTVAASRRRRNASIYLLSRGIPVLGIGIIAANWASAINASVDASLLFLVIGHLLTTNLSPAVIKGLRRLPGSLTPNHISLHLISIVLVVVGAAVARALWPNFRALMPDSEELLQAFWTTLLIGMGAVLLKRVSQYSTQAPDAFQLARKDLGVELENKAYELCEEYEVSSHFILSILLTECLNRPRWFRRLEHIKGRIYGPGTYGVAQAYADRPIDDVESIRLLCTEFRGLVLTEDADELLLRVHFEKHNRRRSFSDQATNFYWHLGGLITTSSQELDATGRPLLEILPLTRTLQIAHIQVAAHQSIARLEVYALLENGEHTVLSARTVKQRVRGRNCFTFDADITLAPAVQVEAWSKDGPLSPLKIEIRKSWIYEGTY